MTPNLNSKSMCSCSDEDNWTMKTRSLSGGRDIWCKKCGVWA